MGRNWLALVSDLHINSTLGLCPATGIELDDGGKYMPSRAQSWLYQCWNDYIQLIKDRWRPGDRIFGVLNGDGPDRNPRTTQLATLNDMSIVKATVDVVEPLRALCTDGFWVVRGTEAHGGDAGHLEEAVARSLNATRYPSDSERYSCWLLRLEIADVRLDLTHHGPLGRLPWTKLNGLGRVAYEIVDEYLAAQEPLPHIAVQAHNHIYGDTGYNYPVRVVALPCFQLQTAYGSKVSPRRRTNIGGVLACLEDGHCTIEPVLFAPKMESRSVQ